MKLIRTPDAWFENLEGYSFEPNFVEIEHADGTPIRIHYLDEGPRDGQIILCMHGQPSWSFLYRKMIPILVDAGFRVLAPDLVGFGKSDKPTSSDDHTYSAHVSWITSWIRKLDLSDLTLMCQDWGGLIGLRVVGEIPDRFKRLVIANTNLPGTAAITDQISAMVSQMYPNIPVGTAEDVRDKFEDAALDAMLHWRRYAAEAETFSVGDVFSIISGIDNEAAVRGYDAPFPDESFLAAPRRMPSLVPIMPEDKPEREAGDRAWKVIEQAGFPILTAFSDGDPLFKGFSNEFARRLHNVTEVTIKAAGHFLQEEQPEELSKAIIEFIGNN